MFIPVLVTMFHPSPLASLPLVVGFILKRITASSSANNFMTTMASSEDPLSITNTLLCRLGLGCRSYSGPAQTALHRVRSRTFFAHSPPLPCGIRKGYWASVVVGTSPPRYSLPEVHTKFGWQFWIQLPSDSSLAHIQLLLPSRAVARSFFGHPCLTYTLPPFRARGRTFTD